MARIISIARRDKERNVVQDEVPATYCVFRCDGDKYFQIETYGNPNRKHPDSVSQTIQFDRKFAKELVAILAKEFQNDRNETMGKVEAKVTELIIGHRYTKAGLGISQDNSRLSEITVHGALYTFFYMDKKYKNIIEDDGFVYEGRDNSMLIPYGVKTDTHRHVFVRMKEEENDYVYLGKGLYETRYNDNSNKIFLKLGGKQ